MAAKKRIGRPLDVKRDKNFGRKDESQMFNPRFALWRHRKIAVSVPVLLLCALLLVGVYASYWRLKLGVNGSSAAVVYSIEVVNEYPHDPEAFTQGLLYAGNDTLFESTGLYKQSSIRRVALRTGKVEVIQKMDNRYFGEGLTLLGDRLFQVTWLEKTGFKYDRKNLSKYEKFTHEMQDGWGLATDGKIIFGSDGTSTLYQIDPVGIEHGGTLRMVPHHGNQTVRFNGHEVYNLNELEYIDGEVWANIWQSDCIARISVSDGMERLIAAGYRGFDVLNGIAWDGEKKRLFVTGKLWPKLYEISLARLYDHECGDEMSPRCHSSYATLEHASSEILTTRTDVYCFGVLVTGIVTGRSPKFLLDCTKSMIADHKTRDVVDPNLPRSPSSKELKQVLLICLRCVDPRVDQPTKELIPKH
ncbi:hypothetical protein MLD38_009009 [Melastoma candidum]|uniref:Uncharacterized protein n=1 Tax=Melastoma candidum TaxID=119954 RepID=A0ACB9S0H5_9MYRT|nr:hypothetical protein MLD38_009009 [Melastoma candidum]